jgi:hypothetical protein
MKREMLEHNYFDTEILFHGQKNERTEDLKKSEKDLLDEATVKEIIEQVKASGEKEYKLMDAQPGVLKKVTFYRKILFFFNIPMVIGIPLFVELGLPMLEKKNASMISMLLTLTDFFLCFNSLIIYSTISKLCTAISYLPEEHKIQIKQMSGRFLTEKVLTFDPKELIKCKKQTLNPFVGYRSVNEANQRFGTESTGLWHDRQLLDSIIFREIKRKRVPRGEKK